MIGSDTLLKPADARAIVISNGGGYGMGLAYAREMIHRSAPPSKPVE